MDRIRRNASDAGLRAWLRGHVGLRIAELSGGADGEGSTTMVRVQLLGAPQLHAADGSMRALERREAALLALLAIEGPMPRARAAALLWSDADSEHARSSLRQRLFKLRRSAGIDVVVPDDVLRIAGKVVHDLVPIAPRLADDPTAGAAELLGDLDYSDCPGLDEWVAVAREQWRSRRIQALAEIAARYETEQKIAAALPYAERLVADDPTLEHGHRRLMRLHYLRGDRAAALAAYDRCHELLRNELGTAPGAETQALRKLIEASGTLPATGARPLPLAILRPPTLIGRDAEWSRIDRACAAGRTVVVLGEPGIGKSRLIADFAARRAAISVGARPGDDRMPFALLARILRALIGRRGVVLDPPLRAELARLLPELGEAAGGPIDMAQIAQAIRRLLAHAADAGAQLLVVDDLHFADAASVGVLPALLSERLAAPLWLLAVRAGEVPDPFEEWLRNQDAQACCEVPLGPLDEAGVRRLLESLALEGLDAGALAGPLMRHTGGNPLFVLETLRARIEDGGEVGDLPAPHSVVQMVERRLQSLSTVAMNLTRLAAIAGPDFDVGLAAHILKREPIELVDAWHEVEAAQVIRDAAFCHDLVFEAALRSVPNAIARQLHLDIAAWLEQQGAEPARVGQHWRAGMQWPRSAAAFEQAAAAAGRGGRTKEHDAWVRETARCWIAADDRRGAFRAMLGMADALKSLAVGDQALGLTQRVLDSARNDHERAHAIALRVFMLCESGGYEACTTLALTGLRLARELQAQQLEAAIASAGAVALAQLRRIDDALAQLESVRGWVEQHGEPIDRQEFYNDLGFVLARAGRLSEAVPAYRLALQAAIDIQRFGDARKAAALLAECHDTIGNLAAAADYAEQSMRFGERLGDAAHAQPFDLYTLGFVRTRQGRFDDALSVLGDALERFRESNAPVWIAATENHLARAYWLLGQHARARRALATDTSALVKAMHIKRLFTQATLALDDEPRRAAELLRSAQALSGTGGSAVVRATIDLTLARLVPPDEAVTICSAIWPVMEASQHRGAALSACARYADSLRRAGRLDEAAAMARDSLERLRDWDPTLYRPEVWWIGHQALDAVDDRAGALTALRCGVEWIKDVGQRHVPEAFRDSFLHRNPINRNLLAAAHRLLD